MNDGIISKDGKIMNEQTEIAREKVLEILQKNGTRRAAFFGSIVRDEMTDESDIDILIEFEGRKSLLDSPV
jgi:predicted nucleotidyltransferase